MLLHAPKSTVIARLRYLVSKSAQGSNAKVTVEYSIKLWLEFSKIKAERKPVDIEMFPYSLWHLQLQSESLRTKAFV